MEKGGMEMQDNGMFDSTNALEEQLKNIEEKQKKEFEKIEEENNELLLRLAERIDFINYYGETGLKGKPYVGTVGHDDIYYDIQSKLFVTERDNKYSYIDEIIKVGLYHDAYRAVADCGKYQHRYNKYVEGLIANRREDLDKLGID